MIIVILVNIMDENKGLMDPTEILVMVIGRGGGRGSSDSLHLHCDVGNWGFQLSS